MTEPLDPETKRLRKISPGELADEVGQLKAAIAALEAKLGAYKDEGVRRELREAEGTLFRITLAPPTQQARVDTKTLRLVMGDPFVDHFSRQVDLDWSLRCFARKAA
jgi:hypothetical protein